jgi:hypothetical protein
MDCGSDAGNAPLNMLFGLVQAGVRVAPSAGFEPAHTAPEADALSPELRGQGIRS